MAKQTIKGDNYLSLKVDVSDTTFHLVKGATQYSGLPADPADDTIPWVAIHEDSEADVLPSGNRYLIDGEVFGSSGIITLGEDTRIGIGKTGRVSGGGGFLSLSTGHLGAIVAGGDSSRINVDRGGEITGTDGIWLGGEQSRLKNAGLIEGHLIGVLAGSYDYGESAASADVVTVVNDGTIRGDIALAIAANETFSLTNGKHGEIIGIGYGVATFGAEPDVSIVNKGEIRGASDFEAFAFAIDLGSGDDEIVNKGRIYGNVELGAGDDSFDTRGGKVFGSIFGGDGDDQFFVSKAGTKLVEDADHGADTVFSTVSYVLGDNVEQLVLIGKKDIDATGNELDNILVSNKADNVLTGLGGEDRFVYQTGGAKDVITDFEHGVDLIDIALWTPFDDYDDVLAHAKDVHAGVRIKLGKDVLLIEGVTIAGLDANDFNFT